MDGGGGGVDKRDEEQGIELKALGVTLSQLSTAHRIH